MQRDKLYGLIIFLVALILLIYLTMANVMIIFAGGNKDYYAVRGTPIEGLFFGPWVYVVAPLFLAEILIFGIAAWIGWTMMTTPPPVPLEELEGLGLDEDIEDKEETA
ncbi:MAG: hypothetical protein HWN67_11135 [Candidatus Helarchaeota archaeon]|nr:hypothetical protein [Candidatus Helarchaeota archaeon]